MPDNTAFMFGGEEPNHGYRVYEQNTHGGPPLAISPDGCVLAGSDVSPGGRLVLLQCGGNWTILRLEDKVLQKVEGIQGSEKVLRWANDGNLWVLTAGMNSARIFKVNPYTGYRQLWKEIHVDSFSWIGFGVITHDGNTFVDTEYASFGALRRVSGLR